VLVLIWNDDWPGSYKSRNTVPIWEPLVCCRPYPTERESRLVQRKRAFLCSSRASYDPGFLANRIRTKDGNGHCYQPALPPEGGQAAAAVIVGHGPSDSRRQPALHFLRDGEQLWLCRLRNPDGRRKRRPGRPRTGMNESSMASWPGKIPEGEQTSPAWAKLYSRPVGSPLGHSRPWDGAAKRHPGRNDSI
jgi:hypothetical protein